LNVRAGNRSVTVTADSDPGASSRVAGSNANAGANPSADEIASDPASPDEPSGQ